MSVAAFCNLRLSSKLNICSTYFELNRQFACHCSAYGLLNAFRRIDALRLIFNAMKNPDNVLNGLLTVYAKCSLNGNIREGIRNSYPYELPRSKTTRMSKSFVVNCIKERM